MAAFHDVPPSLADNNSQLDLKIKFFRLREELDVVGWANDRRGELVEDDGLCNGEGGGCDEELAGNKFGVEGGWRGYL